jgi:hypothetical protein
VLLGLLATLAVTGTAAPANAAAGSNTLLPGESLRAGQQLTSPGGAYLLAMQADGNLVLYWRSRPVWFSGTSGSTNNPMLVLQSDGNLVLYAPGRALWNSKTSGSAPGRLILQEDGNIVLYSQSMGVLWASYSNGARYSDGDAITSPDGQSFAVMQADGNFVVYTPWGVRWASNTSGRHAAYLVLQADGNAVIFSDTVPVWSAGSTIGAFTRLSMGNDGNLVAIAPAGNTVWSTNTSTSSSGARNVDAGIGDLVAIFNNYRASLGLVQEAVAGDLMGYSRSCAMSLASAGAALSHCRTNEIVEYNSAADAQTWFNAWIASPPHKQLIEWASNRYLGAGAAFSPATGRYYVVMNFA